MKYAALYIREDSAYKKRANFDCYDINRDAATFTGGIPVVCHPPCRSWGMLSHMANPREGEKELALKAIDLVRKEGGIIEHPSGSRLFRLLPLVDGFLDDFGGFSIELDQFDFGHVAHKSTKLYICGVTKEKLPKLPPKRSEPTNRSICGNVAGTKRCTQYQREYTPEALIDFFEQILTTINTNKI